MEQNKLEAFLGAFPFVGDGAVLVVAMDSGLGDGVISVTSGLRWKSGGEGGLEVDEEVIFFHGLVFFNNTNGGNSGVGENRFEIRSGL